MVRHTGEEVVALRRDIVARRPFTSLEIDVGLLVALGEVPKQLAERVTHRVLRGERDEDELVAELAELREAGRIRVVEPLERARPVEAKHRLGKASPNLLREPNGRLAVGVGELAPHDIGGAAVEVPERALDREVEPTHPLGRVDRGDRVGARDEHEVGSAEVVGDSARHSQLADHLIRGDQRFAGDVPAPLGKDLILEMRAGDARVDVQLGHPLNVEEVAVAAVHIDDDRRDLEMRRWHTLFRVAHRHGQLELAQRRDRAARAVGDLRPGVEVHIGRAEMPDRERVPREVHGLGAVVHHELGAVRVVDPGREDEGLSVEELPQARGWIGPARGRHAVTRRQQRRLGKAGGWGAKPPNASCHGRAGRARGRCTRSARSR